MACVYKNNRYSQLIKKHILSIDETLKKEWITKVIKGAKSFQVLIFFVYSNHFRDGKSTNLNPMPISLNPIIENVL